QAVLGRITAGPSSPGGSTVGSLPKWAKIVGLCVGLGAIVATGVKLAGPSAPARLPEATPSVAVPEWVPPPTAVEPPAPSAAESAAPGSAAPAPDKAGREPTRAAPSSKSPAQDPDTLPEQVRTITEARLALRRRAFSDALAKVADYEARFPKGVFLEEDLAI